MAKPARRIHRATPPVAPVAPALHLEAPTAEPEGPTFEDAYTERRAYGGIYQDANGTIFNGELAVVDGETHQYVRLAVGRYSREQAGEWGVYVREIDRAFIYARPEELDGLAMLLPALIKLARAGGVLPPAAPTTAEG